MTELEKEVTELRAKLDSLAERVRIDSVAESFIRGDHPIREGDYFLLDGSFPTKLASVSSGGKWGYFNGQNYIEPFRIPDPKDHDRLYTIAEVAAIAAKVSGITAQLAQDLLTELQNWDENINPNPELMRRAREAGLKELP